MSLDVKAIEDALQAWVEKATGVDAIFAHQNAPRPKGQYASVHIMQYTPIGHPDKTSERQSDDSIENDYSNIYNMMVSVNVYRQDAMNKAIALRDSMCKITVKDTMWAAGIAFINSSDVREVPEVLDKVWEDRAQVDFFFYVRSLESETINEVKEIELTNEIDNSTVVIQ